MIDLKLSINGLYLYNEEKIYFVNESKSYDLDDVSFSQWVDIFKENTLFALKNNLLEIKELYSFNRKMVYQLTESFSYDERTKTLFEYEQKFGNNLLVEDTLLLENIFTNSWNWVKNKFSEMGSWAVTLGKNLATCSTGGGCSPFFEQFRELLFNPVSVGVQVFISVAFPGVGNLGMGFVWGIMAIYDGYLLATDYQNFSWLNLIIDILGVVFAGIGLAGAARAAVGGSRGAAAMVGKSLEEVMVSLTKNPKMVPILKSLGNGLTSVSSKLKPIGDFMMNKMGLKWIGRAFKAIEDAVAKIITKISPNANPKYAIAGGKGVRAGAEMGAINTVAHGVGKLGGSGGSVEMEKSIIDANKKIKPNYSGVKW
jgi:hypothetical protein